MRDPRSLDIEDPFRPFIDTPTLFAGPPSGEVPLVLRRLHKVVETGELDLGSTTSAEALVLDEGVPGAFEGVELLAVLFQNSYEAVVILSKQSQARVQMGQKAKVREPCRSASL